MVRYLTTNGKSGPYRLPKPFALRYRRVNRTFYEFIIFDELVKRPFSRKDAKNAKKKSFDINQMALRPLRLGVTF
jgi:hypothetical protein